MLYLDRYWDSDRLIQYFARAGIIVKLDVHHSNTPSVIRNYRRFYYDPYGRRQKDLTDYYYDFKESMASFFS